jgi:mRNA interferase MazF
MLTSGDVVFLDLGLPVGREAGFEHPAIVVTAQRILERQSSVIQIVPMTSTIRPFATEVIVEPDLSNGLVVRSAAQCQHIRAVSAARAGSAAGNVGPVILEQIREVLATILDIGP